MLTGWKSQLPLDLSWFTSAIADAVMQAASTHEERLAAVEAQLALLTTIGQHVSAITTLFQWFMGGLALITIVTFFREWLNSKGQRDTVALTNELLGMVKTTMSQSAGLFRRVAKEERVQVADDCAAILRDAPEDDYEYRYLASNSLKHTEVRIRARDVDRLEGQLKLQRNIYSSDFFESDIAQKRNGPGNNKIGRFLRRRSVESDDSLSLPDVCLFIAGMNHHLDMNWREAIKCWSLAYDNAPEWPSSANKRGIKRKAKMWIAREFNNIGEHKQALDWLQRAGDGDQTNLPLLAYTHETMYYRTESPQAIEKVAKDAKGDLWERVMKPEPQNRAQRSAAGLLGNLLLVDMIVRGNCTDAERGRLTKCFEIGGDTWSSSLGLAQYYDAILDEKKRTEWAKKVLAQLNSPAELRWEPHARLLRKSATLMCVAWLDESDIKASYRGVIDEFGLVRAPLAISSPLTKKQEPWEDGLAQMQDIMDNKAEWVALGGAAARLRRALTSVKRNIPTRH